MELLKCSPPTDGRAREERNQSQYYLRQAPPPGGGIKF